MVLGARGLFSKIVAEVSLPATVALDVQMGDAAEHVREDLNNSGVEDATTTDKTIILCVHRASFVRGSRRDPRVEMDKAIKTSITTMVSSMRRGFVDIQDSGTFNNVSVAVNIS